MINNTLNIKSFNDSDEAVLVYQTIRYTNYSLFVTGKAGTGKSTLLKLILKDVDKKFAVLAPTGIAAKNIEGRTIHSFFGLPFGIIFNDDKKIRELKYKKSKEDIIRDLELLIIDEISMVPSSMLDCIDALLKGIMGNSRPFGGKQVLLMGDPYQLPPVVTDGKSKILNKYASEYFFDSKVFKELQILKGRIPMIELTHCYRQKEEYFMEILNSFRANKVTQEMINKLNSCCVKSREALSEDTIILTVRNQAADKLNQDKLNKLDSQLYSYEGISEGKFSFKDLLVEKKLLLKEGARVMFLKNSEEFKNGTLGVVKKLDDNQVFVELEDGKVIEVLKELFKEMEGDSEEVTGTFLQYPIRLAWAITIHKSQGLTLPKMHIDLTYRTFAHGQLYVALSRCETIEGLSFSTPIRLTDIIVDPKISQFYSKVHEQRNIDLIFNLIEELEKKNVA